MRKSSKNSDSRKKETPLLTALGIFERQEEKKIRLYEKQLKEKYKTTGIEIDKPLEKKLHEKAVFKIGMK